MEYKKLTLPAFQIVGICVATSNGNEVSQKDIGDLWKRFFDETISLLIANRESNDIYCAYTDYNPANKEEYTCIIGHRVIGTTELRSPMTEITVPAGLFYEFDSLSGEPSKLLNTWEHIWAANYPRTYQVDFDLYRSDLADNDRDEVVNSYISVST